LCEESHELAVSAKRRAAANNGRVNLNKQWAHGHQLRHRRLRQAKEKSNGTRAKLCLEAARKRFGVALEALGNVGIRDSWLPSIVHEIEAEISAEDSEILKRPLR
jgi:hypothetical protein